MKKLIALAALAAALLSSCDLFFNNKADESGEPAYTARIAWVSDTNSFLENSMMGNGDDVYLFECVENSTNLRLTKLDARTGEVLWRSLLLHDLQQCRPVVIDNHVYAFLNPNLIYRFDKRTGELSAKVQVDIDNQALAMYWNAIGHNNYLYFGLGNYSANNYFVRLDVNTITSDENSAEQALVPEIIWRPQYDRAVGSTPAIKDNVIYVYTTTKLGVPVELAGVNMETKTVEFYKLVGVTEELIFDNGLMRNSLLIQDDILYFLSWSISAYNLKSNEQLYQKIFFSDTPHELVYYPGDSLGETFYNGKIYYTTILNNYFNNGYRNIHCIDAKTSNLVWNDLPQETESLGTNPIIAHEKMYVPHAYGLRVYNPDTGKLIGVDKEFNGYGGGRNILYGDYMITARYDHGAIKRQIVAIDVSK
jgi:outer membrane protein assembly factor BamB